MAPATPPPPAADPPPPAPSPAPAAAGASADTTGEDSTRGKRLGKEWALPKAWGDWALDEFPHWTADIVRKIGATFRDHWVAQSGKAGVKNDWEATWRNWCRSTITQREYPPPRGTAARETREQRLASARAALDALNKQRPVRPTIVNPAQAANTIDMPGPPAVESSDA